MRRTRKARLKQTMVIKEEESFTPTLQTEEKLRKDTMISLLATGDISSDHVRVAEELRAVFETVSRGMFPASSWRAEASPGRIDGREWILWIVCRIERPCFGNGAISHGHGS